MARLGRYFVADQALHVIQRGVDRQAVFFRPDDTARYRDWLIAAAEDYGCAVHAYVFMTNHVHLLVKPQTANSLPRMMQSLRRRYVRYVNWSHKRTGTMWEGTLSCRPHRQRRLLPRLLPVHRAQPGARAHGGSSP